MIKITLLLLLFSSCYQSTSNKKDCCCCEPETPVIDTAQTYIIPKGWHYSKTVSKQLLTTDQQLIFVAEFDSSCIYKSVLPENQGDINKLYGFSDCSNHHQNNSARIGWNWDRDSLRLYAYVYNDQQRIHQELTTLNIGEQIHCQISIVDSNYVFIAGEQTAIIKRGCTGSYRHYTLFPYFGGNERAPHNITIKITNL